jgi:hypothetical protein
MADSQSITAACTIPSRRDPRGLKNIGGRLLRYSVQISIPRRQQRCGEIATHFALRGVPFDHYELRHWMRRISCSEKRRLKTSSSPLWHREDLVHSPHSPAATLATGCFAAMSKISVPINSGVRNLRGSNQLSIKSMKLTRQNLPLPSSFGCSTPSRPFPG